MEQKSVVNKFNYFSILRILATFLVVLLHVSAYIVNKFGDIGTGSWNLSNVFDSITRSSVAILFMVSGALLLGKKESLSIFYKKRLIKIVIPFLFWQLFYLFNSVAFQIKPFTSLFKIKETYYNLFFRYNWYHLWFIPVIIGIYLLTPFIRQWISSIKKSQIFQVIIVWLISIILNDICFYIFNKSIINSSLIFGIGYFILGYYLSICKFKIKTKYLTLLLLLSVSFTAITTAFFTMRNNLIFTHSYNYYSVSNCITAIVLFLIIKRINWEKMNLYKVEKIIPFINSCCFGIYFIHPKIIELLILKLNFFQQGLRWYNFLFEIPVLAIITFLISLGIIAILKTNKITNKLI